MLTLKKSEISVSSFEYLEKVLQTAGDKKISETRACLESKRMHVYIVFVKPLNMP